MLSGIPPFKEQCGGLCSALLGPMTDLEGAKRAHAEHTPRARCLLAIQQHTANADATPMLSQVLMDVGRLLGLC